MRTYSDSKPPPVKEQKRRQPAWHGLAAGSVAGASGVLIGHAFDTAKVQAQVGTPASRVTTPMQVPYRTV